MILHEGNLTEPERKPIECFPETEDHSQTVIIVVRFFDVPVHSLNQAAGHKIGSF